MNRKLVNMSDAALNKRGSTGLEAIMKGKFDIVNGVQAHLMVQSLDDVDRQTILSIQYI